MVSWHAQAAGVGVVGIGRPYGQPGGVDSCAGQSDEGRRALAGMDCGAESQPRHDVLWVMRCDIHAGERHHQRRDRCDEAETAGHEPRAPGDRPSHHRVIGWKREIGAALRQHQNPGMGRKRAGLVHRCHDRLIDRDRQQRRRPGTYHRGHLGDRPGSAGDPPAHEQ
jgi:hypothetical protein